MSKERLVLSGDLASAWAERYPNDALASYLSELLDTDYTVPPPDLPIKAYNAFWRWMKLSRLLLYRVNKMDCDKRSRLFLAYLIALAGRKETISSTYSVAWIRYKINGQTGRNHVITSWFMGDYVLELDPKPAKEHGGIVTLSEIELASVDRLIA